MVDFFLDTMTTITHVINTALSQGIYQVFSLCAQGPEGEVHKNVFSVP